MSNKAWQDRIRAEHAVLRDRLDRLNAFNLSSDYDKLDKTQQKLLFSQAVAMTELAVVLDERIASFDPPGPPQPFHWALQDVVTRTRKDATVSDDTMVLMILGVLHEYVRRPDVREKAVKAIEKLFQGNDEQLPDAEVVDAVVKSVMGGP